MLDEIKTLEKTALLLEPGPVKCNKTTQAVEDFAGSFLQTLDHRKAYVNSKTNGAGFTEFLPGEDPCPIERLLTLLENELLEPGLNPASAGHLGYIPSGGIYAAALGDYLAAVTNRYATLFYVSPGAVRMENMLVKWMCSLIGYPDQSSGYLSSGGSMANLSAIVAARDAKKITSKNTGKSVIYYTHQAHHCVIKAIRITGLSEGMQRVVPMNENFQMDVGALKSLIENDIKNGFHPWLVVAAAGTTDMGAIDPLEDIAAVAKKYNMWYHIDAAYGGFFLLTPSGKQKLKGISQADSIVMDPHKGLFLPYGTGALLVKNKENLFRSFHFKANYLQDANDPDDQISPSDISPELSRQFRGLRLWLPLQLHGLKPFRASLEEKLLLTQYFYKEIKKMGFETGPEPELSVMIYRYVPEELKDDQDAINDFNRSLLKAVLDDGRLFISSTTLDGHFWLRLAVLSFRTHLEHIQLLLEILKEKVNSEKI